MKKLEVEEATPQERAKAVERTGLSDLTKLRNWLEATDRRFVVFVTKDLVDALEPLSVDGEPVALQMFQQIVSAYQAERNTKPAGARQVEVEAPDGSKATVEEVVYKDDRLTTEELDQAIRFLTRQMYDRNPNWSLTDPPL